MLILSINKADIVNLKISYYLILVQLYLFLQYNFFEISYNNFK